ncbi:glycosyltransferase family 9 protein, partial [Sphingobacterium multivorum]
MFKIAIFRALQLGDLLSSIPAIRALKSHYPDARLYFIGLPHMRVLMERFDCIDEYVDFPGHPQLPEIAYNPDNLERFV